MIATCGACANTFYVELPGRHGCPACRSEVWVSELPPVAPPIVDAIAIEPASPPWERRAAIGRLAAFWSTVRLALFDPRTLFTDLDRTDRAGALRFYLLAIALPEWIGSSLELGFGTPFDWIASLRELFTTMQDPAALAQLDRLRVLEELAHHPTWLAAIFAVFIPLQALVRLYSSAWSTHWVLKRTGPLPGSFDLTLKAYAYAETPRILSVVPFVLVPVAFVWSWALGAYAVAKAHRLSGLRAVVAVVVAPVASGVAVLVLVGVGAWWLTQLLTGLR